MDLRVGFGQQVYSWSLIFAFDFENFSMQWEELLLSFKVAQVFMILSNVVAKGI
jgi:hypothetical protein